MLTGWLQGDQVKKCRLTHDGLVTSDQVGASRPEACLRNAQKKRNLYTVGYSAHLFTLLLCSEGHSDFGGLSAAKIQINF